MISLRLLDRATIAQTMALMSAERAAVKPAGLVKQARTAAPLPHIAGLKPRSPKTTNTERKLADLEWAVTQGLMTAREAYDAFGRKLPGTGGRRRAPGQEDFRAWLVRRIERLSDHNALLRLADSAAAAQDRSLSRGKQLALIREINRLSWQHDRDYVDKLRAALAELDEGSRQ